jgi:hypothetical protein
VEQGAVGILSVHNVSDSISGVEESTYMEEQRGEDVHSCENFGNDHRWMSVEK